MDYALPIVEVSLMWNRDEAEGKVEEVKGRAKQAAGDLTDDEDLRAEGEAQEVEGKVLVDWVAVGRRVREIRGFDMTQEEFAERIGISQNYLSTMERGKVEIGAEILLRISREFAKSVEWLLTGES
jgi:uncharacterized protein YjbJ (UPF0337 family)/DNA-binding XRE family transcriptional regulator